MATTRRHTTRGQRAEPERIRKLKAAAMKNRTFRGAYWVAVILTLFQFGSMFGHPDIVFSGKTYFSGSALLATGGLGVAAVWMFVESFTPVGKKRTDLLGRFIVAIFIGGFLGFLIGGVGNFSGFNVIPASQGNILASIDLLVIFAFATLVNFTGAFLHEHDAMNRGKKMGANA